MDKLVWGIILLIMWTFSLIAVYQAPPLITQNSAIYTALIILVLGIPALGFAELYND